MSKPNFIESLRCSITTQPRDFSLNQSDAWVYGIIAGWDSASLSELSEKHNWDRKTVARLVQLHNQFINSCNP